MKKAILLLALLACGTSLQAQNKSDLLTHYEAFYNRMRLQGDVNGVIHALTHLQVLDPSKQRLDTLAYVYMNNSQHLQALNTIGVETDANDSELAVQVKAVSLKALNQPVRAAEQFQILFDRAPNPFLAYELADLKIQLGDNATAATAIDYGIENATADMKYAFFERQQPYEVPIKAALLHLRGLVEYNNDKNNIDKAIASIDEALEIEPNFNLASLSKQALESRKNNPEGGE